MEVLQMLKNRIIQEFEDRVIDVIETSPVPELQVRYRLIEELNEEFYQKTTQNLPPHLLSMLTDWVLIEVLKDKDVDKVANSEYAVLSHRQLRRRDKRENSVQGEVLDYLELRYVKQMDSLKKTVRTESEY